MIVMKFGGTSVQDEVAISRAIQAVIRELPQRPVVVLSALGKATNQLLEIARRASSGEREAALSISEELMRHHMTVANRLTSASLLSETEEQLDLFFLEIANIIQGLFLLGECTPRSQDAIASFGERMSTWIFSQALREKGYAVELLDSRQLIKTDDQFTRAVVQQEISFKNIREAVAPAVEQGKIAVLQGFIGSTLDGVTTTIGRGGTDYTASLVGAAAEAQDIQIWTDVPGILTTDPRIVREALKIKAISFNEASELAYFGAKVLHPSTLLPAIHENIPIHVCDSSKIDQPGTFISADAVPSRTPVKSIACKRGITVVNIHSTRMLLAYGFLSGIFEVFEKHRTVVDVVSTSEVSVSLTIDSTERLEQIISDLQTFGEADFESNMAIICIVGDNVRYAKGIASRVFGAVEDLNVRMISQGASRINLTFLVDEDNMEETVRRLHAEFFRDPDPEVFENV